ncbi:MAG: DUF2164 domain-containing protein [Thalassotalea sp.]
MKISTDNKTLLLKKLHKYFEDELNQELGQFEGEFLLDFIFKELTPAIYNQGLYDAQAILTSKLDDLHDAIYEIEKVVS